MGENLYIGMAEGESPVITPSFHLSPKALSPNPFTASVIRLLNKD